MKTWGFDRSVFWHSWIQSNRPDLNIWSIGYEAAISEWSGSAMPLEDRALNVLALLDNRSIGQKPICFICHSMGGLLVKELLRHASTVTIKYKDIAQNTKGIVFFATPNTGTSLADIASFLGFVLNQTVAVDQLTANSVSLRALNLWFRNNFQALGVKICIFAEKQPTKGFAVVNDGSADPGIPNISPIPIDASHTSIVRPQSYQDIVVGQTLKLIDDAIPGEFKFDPERSFPDAKYAELPDRSAKLPRWPPRRRDLLIGTAGIAALGGAGLATRLIFFRPATENEEAVPLADGTTDASPRWLATMRQINGTRELHDNPVILGWAKMIGSIFPEMAAYCAEYRHDTAEWAGLTVAYCMAVNGIRPVFGDTPEDRFLSMDAWKQFGSLASTPRLGDVVTFDFGNGHHHVTLYERTEGSTYICNGGNQNNEVRLSTFAIRQCSSIRRPPLPVKQMRIVAILFGGLRDPVRSAYDAHLIDDQELSVSLPYRFADNRPKVRVWNNGQFVLCKIVDVGPWSTNDPYWQTGARPKAEQNKATNLAGMALAPAVFRFFAISQPVMTVDWEFAQD